MTGRERLTACRAVRDEYQAGQLDLVTAIVEVDEIMCGDRPLRRIPPAVITFLTETERTR